MKTSTFYYLLTFFFISSISHSQEYIDASTLFSILGESPGDTYGTGTYAGDLNKDGFDDFIIRAKQNDENGQDAGKAYVYFGGINFDKIVDMELYGESPGDLFGVAAAGDFNVDGYDDLIIGAPYNDVNGNDAGRTYIYLGGLNMDNVPDIIISGNTGDHLSIVANAGDLNGDGIDDFVIGTAHTNNLGYVKVYFGGQNINAEPDLVIYGESAEDRFGSYLSSAGDINGDGFDDIMISGYRNYTGAPIAGKVYIYFGGINMDNIADITITGNEESGYLGWGLSNVGDVNNDGYDDILIGAWAQDAGGHDNGKAYLFFGSENMDNLADVIFTGKQYEENFGEFISYAGDINEDNFDDFIIGTRGKGKTYLYFGGEKIIDQPSVIFNKENAGDGFGRGNDIGDINGDGIMDIVLWAPLNDDNGTDAGKAYFYISEYSHQIPVITKQPTDTIVNEGETAVFKVEVTCNDSIGYQWWRHPYVSQEESKLVDIPNKIEGATTNELKILNTTVSDDNNSQYVCEVYNTYDHQNLWVNSEPTTLRVNSIDQIITIKIETDSVWYDDNYDGVELGLVDASASSVNIGQITAYLWTLHSDTVGYGKSPVIELPAGTNELLLTVITDLGNIKKETKIIDVYAAELKTNGELYSSVSWLDNKTLFISSTDDKIYKFDSTGTVAWTILTGGSILSTICVSNENNIYAASTDTRFYAFDKNGAPRWDKAMGGIIASSPSVGPDSTIYIGLNSGRLFSIKENGDLLWSLQTDGAIISSPVISNRRVYFGNTDKKVYCVSTETGEILNTYATEDSVLSSPAVGKDGSIIIGSNDGYIYKFNSDLKLIWKFYTLGKVISSPVIDEIGNIFIGSSSGFVYALSKDRLLLWKYNAGSPVNGSPSLGKNGSVYIGCDNGRLLVLSRTGKLLWYLQTEGPVRASALITPNRLIYLASTDGNVYIIKDPLMYFGFNQIFEWPTYKGNNRRTGSITLNPTNVKQVKNIIPTEFSLSQNYPNPFNPSTIIGFMLSEKSYVKLTIFNILGKEIKTLLNTELNTGLYNIEFNASNLPSGTYIYKLQTNKLNQSRKMLLLK